MKNICQNQQYVTITTAPREVSHVYDSTYDMCFQNLVETLSDQEMDVILPIFVRNPTDNEPPLNIEWTAHNWAAHSVGYVKTACWFRDLAMAHEYDDKVEDDTQYMFMVNLFQSLTPEQKTILQRGYDIMKFDAWAPLLDGTLYVVGLEDNPDRKTEMDFPIRPIKRSLH